jgi:hypothetical protein
LGLLTSQLPVGLEQCVMAASFGVLDVLLALLAQPLLRRRHCHPGDRE